MDLPYILAAHIAKVHIGLYSCGPILMAYIATAYGGMVPYRYGLSSDALYTYCLYSHSQYGYGLYPMCGLM